MKLAVVFDLDGTLINTLSGIVKALTATLESIGVVVNDSQAIRSTVGRPLIETLSKLLNVECDSERVTYAVKQYQAFLKEFVLPKARELIFPGVEEGLAKLKSNNFTLAIATNKAYANAEALVKAAGLWNYFSAVVGVDQVAQPKPHPAMGILAMKTLGVLPQHAVMVGDTTHDILMAKDSGMRSIAVTYGVHDNLALQSAEPTWMTDTFPGVIECVQRNLCG